MSSPRWISTMLSTTSLKPYKFQYFTSFWPSRGVPKPSQFQFSTRKWSISGPLGIHHFGHLPTTSSSSPTLHLKSFSESNFLFTDIKMLKNVSNLKQMRTLTSHHFGHFVLITHFAFKINLRIKFLVHTHENVKKRQSFKANTNADVSSPRWTSTMILTTSPQP